MWRRVELMWKDVSEEHKIYTMPHPRRRNTLCLFSIFDDFEHPV
jgi:hypothetical protein